MRTMKMKQEKSVNMFSKSFKKGFVGGFTSPASIFISQKIHRPSEYDGSVERAWREVGSSLSNATKIEADRLGQKTGTQKRRATKAA